MNSILPTSTIAACVIGLGCLLTGRLLGDDQTAEKWIDLKLQHETVWDACNFGGDGEIEFSEKQVVLEMGDPLTGIRLVKAFPRDNYEIQLEATRLEGLDFFVGLTFPVADSHCSLILGGWSGSVVGLSNINGADASNNPTTREGYFDNDRWYSVRLRVEPDRIVAWVDDKQVVDQSREGIEFGIRGEMDPSTPLGIAAYHCKVAYRNIRYCVLEAKQGDPRKPAENRRK